MQRAFVNGNVLTIDAEFRVASAVGVDRGRIVAVGSDAEITARADSSTEIVDLRGQTMMPGIHDGHIHFAMWALQRPPYSVGLADAASIAVMVERVAARAAAAAPGAWVRGHGWRAEHFAEFVASGRMPNRHDLDPVSGEHPVLLNHFSEHGALVNSRALALAGIDATTPDPPGGEIVRDGRGEPTGYLVESAAQLVADIVPPLTDAEQDQALLDGADALRRLGYTSITDPMVGAELIRRYVGLGDRLGLRVGLLAHWTGLGLPNSVAELRTALSYSGPNSGFGDERLFIAGAKLFADGIPPLGTAWTSKPYGGGCCGMLLTEGDTEQARYDELLAMIDTLHRARFNVQIHVTGDRACDAAVDGIIAAMDADPWPQARHALIHGNLLSPETARRMAPYGINVNVNSLIKWTVADALPAVYGDARAGYSMPMRTLIDAGLHVADTSDAPVVEPDWRQGVECLVLRESRGTKTVSGPQERITRAEALRAWTYEAAWQEGTETIKGSIEVGKLADFVVLGADPLTVDDHDLHLLPVTATVIGGETVAQG